MAVIAFSDDESWVMARWAYRMLMMRVTSNLTIPEDVLQVEQCEALDGLNLDLVPDNQRERLAAALLSAATSLREDLLATPSDDPRDAGLARILGEIMAAVGVHYPHLRDEPDPAEST
jgi:hypothetical protein